MLFKRALDFITLKLSRRIEIRFRLINSFIIVSLFPLVVSGLLSYADASRAIEDKTRLYFVEIVKQVSKNVQLQMDQIEAASEELILSDRMQTALMQYQGKNEAAKIHARSELTKVLLDKYGSFDYINQKYVLDNDYRVMDSQVFSALGDSVVRLAGRLDVGARPSWNTYRVSASQKSVAMLRGIIAKDNNRQAGILFIGIKPSQFSGIFDSVDLGNDSTSFILDINDGSIIVKSRQAADFIGAETAEPALAKEIALHVGMGKSTDFIGFTDGKHVEHRAAFSQIPRTSWYVVTAIPLQNLNQGAQSIRDEILWIGLVCFVLSLVLSYIISRSISVPLNKLVGVMKATETGNYRLRMQYEGNDEITVLAQKFNEMASRVREQHERLEERVAERTRDLEQATRSLEILSVTDGLTGIANRRRFDQVLENEMPRALRSQRPLTLMMLDVDLFKSYNDFYGHQAGDDCLRDVAVFLQSCCRRSSDLVARYGGEEFTFVGIDTDPVSALELAESIRQRLQALNLPHLRSPTGCVTVSIGVVSLVPDARMTPESLLRMADAAMYRAKNEGRNRVSVAPGGPLTPG